MKMLSAKWESDLLLTCRGWTTYTAKVVHALVQILPDMPQYRHLHLSQDVYTGLGQGGMESLALLMAHRFRLPM